MAQGYSQKKGLNYDEAFSPVLRSESIHSVNCSFKEWFEDASTQIHIHNVLNKFGFEQCKAVNTPVASGTKLLKSELKDAILYQSAEVVYSICLG